MGQSRQTIRQFVGAVALMAILIALFKAGMEIEPVSNPKDGVVGGQALRGATVFTGIAHFTIAFLFMWTDPRTSTRDARRKIFLGLGIGAALCAFAFTVASVVQTFFLSGFVGFYFLAHELRDEYVFSKSYGEVPEKGVGRAALLRMLGAVVLVAAALGWNYLFIKPTARGVKFLRPWLNINALGGAERLAVWLIPIGILVVVAAMIFVVAIRKAGRPLKQFFRDYWPLLTVYAGIAVMLMADLKSQKTLYLVVLFHVAAWWVFTTRRLAQQGRTGSPRALGWVEWFKRTQAGFQTLHIGLTVATLLVGVLWVYAFQKSESNPLSWFVSAKAFSYWTIMHVTVSFIPRPA